MNIKQAAAMVGLPAKTLRFYEQVGISEPGRAANGYRTYSARDLRKLAFVARARSLGFSLDDCRRLLALYEDRDRTSAEVRAFAQDHVAQIDRKLAELRAMRGELSGLIEACRGDRRPDCPIMDSLASDDIVKSGA